LKILLSLAFLVLFPWGVIAGPMDLFPEGTDPLPSAAEAGNSLFVSGTDSSTLITSSFQDAVGLYTLNQASGSLNDQSNCLLLSFGELEVAEIGGYLSTGRRSDASVLQDSESRDLIEGSFSGSRGAFLLNQSAGSMNVQGNALLLSIGGGPLALGDLELDAQRPEGEAVPLEERGGSRGDLLVDSFNGASGVGLISQSAGNMNTIHNTVGISFRHQVIR